LPLTIRAPTIDELSGLSDLCFRSKAVWGYDEEFMEACRGELSFEPRDLELTPIAVAEHDGNPSKHRLSVMGFARAQPILRAVPHNWVLT
jgi:hypothetical protein